MSAAPQLVPLYFDRASRRLRDAFGKVGRQASHLERFAPVWQSLNRQGLTVTDINWDRDLLHLDGFAGRPRVEWRWWCFSDLLSFADSDDREVASIGLNGDAADLAQLDEAIIRARYGDPAEDPFLLIHPSH